MRENQRRSRARRKQYLQELEEKFRKCEVVGAQASSEIQSAARRVLEENHRLRSMLKARGVTDQEINSFTNTSVETLPLPGATFDQPPSTPAEELTQGLKAFRACSTPDCLPKSGASKPRPSAASGTKDVQSLQEDDDAPEPSVCCIASADPSRSSRSASACKTADDENQLDTPAVVSSTDRPIEHASPQRLDPVPLSFERADTVAQMQTDLWQPHHSHAPDRLQIPHVNTQNGSDMNSFDDIHAPGGLLQMLLSEDGHSRFRRYLGIDDTPQHGMHSSDDAQNGNAFLGLSHSAPPHDMHGLNTRMNIPVTAPSTSSVQASTSPAELDMPFAYCYRSKSWKRVDDPCWVVSSMIAAEMEIQSDRDME